MRGRHRRPQLVNGRQELTNQTRELHAYAERIGWRVVGEYLDQVSGRNADRPQFQAAMEDARKRKFDLLLFWSLDRLSREGVLKTLLILNQLSGYGVKYRSLQEQWVDSFGAFSDAIVGILATVGEVRGRAPIEPRPQWSRQGQSRRQSLRACPRAILNRDKLVAMRKKGMSLREIATATGRSAMTIQTLLKGIEAEGV